MNRSDIIKALLTNQISFNEVARAVKIAQRFVYYQVLVEAEGIDVEVSMSNIEETTKKVADAIRADHKDLQYFKDNAKKEFGGWDNRSRTCNIPIIKAMREEFHTSLSDTVWALETMFEGSSKNPMPNYAVPIA